MYVCLPEEPSLLISNLYQGVPVWYCTVCCISVSLLYVYNDLNNGTTNSELTTSDCGSLSSPFSILHFMTLERDVNVVLNHTSDLVFNPVNKHGNDCKVSTVSMACICLYVGRLVVVLQGN